MAIATATTDPDNLPVKLTENQLATLNRIARKHTSVDHPAPNDWPVEVADLPRSCYPSLRPLARAGMLFYDHTPASPTVTLTLQGLILWRLMVRTGDPAASDPTHPDGKPEDLEAEPAAAKRRPKAPRKPPVGPRLAETLEAPAAADPPRYERFAPGDEARVWERIHWAQSFAHAASLERSKADGLSLAVATRQAFDEATRAGTAEWEPAWAEFLTARGINRR